MTQLPSPNTTTCDLIILYYNTNKIQIIKETRIIDEITL